MGPDDRLHITEQMRVKGDQSSAITPAAGNTNSDGYVLYYGSDKLGQTCRNSGESVSAIVTTTVRNS